MHTGINDPLLQSRAMNEIDIIKKIENQLARKTFGIPYLVEENLLPALLAFSNSAVEMEDQVWFP